jgi:hypothetical protein
MVIINAKMLEMLNYHKQYHYTPQLGLYYNNSRLMHNKKRPDFSGSMLTLTVTTLSNGPLNLMTAWLDGLMNLSNALPILY